jgi:DNA helicase-2/ATP-dependent DNA helicase PcrA
MLLPGIGVRTVERLLELIIHYDNLSDIVDKVFTPFCTGQKNSEVFVSLKALLQAISGPSMLPSRQIELVMEHYGPIMQVKYKKDPSRVKELAMLGQMAQRYRTLKDFLADVAVDPDKDSKDDDFEFLTLSTVHSAKGLEWGRVFLIGLLDGVFPSSRSFIAADEGDIEEEKRLFYVAVTRAKEELFLSFYIRKGTNERSVGKLCRFLEPANVRTTFEKRTVGPLSRPAHRRSRY